MTMIKATRTDHDALVETLMQSFWNEEFCNWAVQAEKLSFQQKHAKLEQFFSIQLKDIAQPYNEVYTNSDRSAAALWIPPNQWDLNLIQQVKLLPQLTKIIGLRQLVKFIHIINLVQKHHPSEAHYYLQLIGVSPDHQGQGLASKVLTPILTKSDQHGIPCYLETATPSNVGLYRHYGFEVIFHLRDLPYDAPEIWGMWRKPTHEK